MPDSSKLEKLNRELEKSEKKLRKAINDEKALQHQLKQLTRKERTHRLCTRGGMLESFLQEPERLTDDDVMLLLKLIFHRQDTQELLKKLTRSERTHRLCTRAGMLEAFLREPTVLTDDDVMELLTFLFHSEAAQNKLDMLIEERKKTPETAGN